MENTKNTITIKHGAAAPTDNDLSLYEFGYSSNEDDIYLKVDKDGTVVLRSEKGIINQLIESSLAPIHQDIKNIRTHLTDFNTHVLNSISRIDNTFAEGFTLNNAELGGASTIGKILAKDSSGAARDLIYRNSSNVVVVGDQQPGSTAGSLYLGVGSDKNVIVARPDGTDGAIVRYPVFDSKNVKELLYGEAWTRRSSKTLGSDKLKYNFYLAKIKDSDSFVLLTKTETETKIGNITYDYKLQGMNIKFQDVFSYSKETDKVTATYNDPYIELVQIFVRSSDGRFYYADGRRYKLSTSGITLEYGGSSGTAKSIEEFWGIL